MITYKKLKKKPRAFKSIDGVTITDFPEKRGHTFSTSCACDTMVQTSMTA